MSKRFALPFPEPDPSIASILRGDPGTLREVDRWIDVVFHSGEALTFRADWDDLRQEIRARVIRNLSRGEFHGRSNLRTYVHSIAKHVCIDFARTSRRRARLDSQDDWHLAENPGSGLAASIARDFVSKLLDGFSEDERLLLELVFVEGCSYEEVASRLSVAQGTVKSRVSRCKERLLRRRRQLSKGGAVS